MNINFWVHLFHILIVGSLFIYVGINREKIPNTLFKILLGLGIFIIFYHIFKATNYIKQDKSIWVNLIHIFIVGPTLIFIGYNNDKTPRRYFEILLMLGFATIGYHAYYLVNP